MDGDIWAFLHVQADLLDESDFGLVAEARRLAQEAGGGAVSVLIISPESVDPATFQVLGAAGADRVFYWCPSDDAFVPDELFAQALFALAAVHPPKCILMVHGPETAAAAARLGALRASAVVTRAVDARWEAKGVLAVQRSLSDELLHEHIEAESPPAPVVTFLPEVLASPTATVEARGGVILEPLVPAVEAMTLRTKTIRIEVAKAGQVSLEEAEIIVAAGRGAGSGAVFGAVNELAGLLDGVAAGTRPVIDAHLLPFERQIGQTGKSVTPRLLINCGISGANEYTAGIEGARKVVAINIDRRAPIFAWADLGLVGDVQQLLPLLIDRLKNRQKGTP